MSNIRAILAGKSGDVLSIVSTEVVFEAVRRMAEAGVGSILVIDDGELRGIFTERDYLRRIALERRRSTETLVADAMTTKLIVVGPDETVEQCMAVMTEQRIRHLPIMEGGKLIGLVSIGDLVRHVTRQQAEQIRYLTDFVSGSYPG